MRQAETETLVELLTVGAVADHRRGRHEHRPEGGQADDDEADKHRRRDGATARSTLTAIAATSDNLTGARRPLLSARRPTNGARTASSPAAPRKAPAMTIGLAPRAFRRSGVRTSMTPKEIPARQVSHMPAVRPTSRSARAALCRL